MKLFSLQLGSAVEVGAGEGVEWWDKPWRTALFKQPRPGAHWLGYEGLRGDEQADRKHHGGVDKAVCVYPAEHYPFWRTELALPELPHGAFGENFTTQGLTEDSVCIGDVFTVGAAQVQISQPRQPCWKLARRWRIKDLPAQAEQNGRTGFYFRVLRHGLVQAGDDLKLEDRPWPRWTIQRCNEVMHHLKHDAAAARGLSECPQLSGSWKDALWARAENAQP